MLKRFMICCAAVIASFAVTVCPVHAEALSVYLVADNTAEMASRENMIGRLFIPDSELNVALTNVEHKTAEYVQSATDAVDSAAWFHYGKTLIVADHKEQGFDRIRNAVPGESYAYIQNGTKIDKYLCVDSGLGHNHKHSLSDKNDAMFNTYPENTMITYTCYNGWQNVYYCVWQPVPEVVTTD